MKILFIMDPIEKIKPARDTTLALMLEAQLRGFDIYYTQIQHLYIVDGQASTLCQKIVVSDNQNVWFKFLDEKMPTILESFNCILMRKDPPLDMAYIYATQILELAVQKGTYVCNAPALLREATEKMAISYFPELTPPSIVSSEFALISDFIETHKKVVLKPLDLMGGTGILLAEKDSPNNRFTIETMTEKGKIPIMAQKYLPKIKKGDKRIFIIDGAVLPYGLKRTPPKGDFRANLSLGGTGEGFKLNRHDLSLSEKIAPTLKAKGALFVGLDVIGEHLTEINITSPTCIREVNLAFDLNISALIWDAIQSKIQS